MGMNWGNVPLNSVIPFTFDSFDGGTGASITLTGFAVTDVEIYKGVSMTQRASDSGVVLTDTDGIDLDTITGIHGFSIDTADNADAGFYAVGSFYTVIVSAVTIDAQTVNFVAGSFRLTPIEGIAGHPKVDVGGWLGTAAATPTVAGVPEVDLTHVAGSTTSVSTIASSVATLLADWLNGGRLDLILDIIAADTTTDIPALIATLQAFVDTEVASILAAVDTEVAAILAAVVTNAAGVDIAADIIAIKAETAAILDDTDDIGIAGAGLTAIPWNAAWDAEVQSEVADALEATIADSIPADGTIPSVKQALYMLTQFMLERAVSSTTVTVKKADGSTTLFTLTLDSATAPASITRAT